MAGILTLFSRRYCYFADVWVGAVFRDNKRLKYLFRISRAVQITNMRRARCIPKISLIASRFYVEICREFTRDYIYV